MIYITGDTHGLIDFDKLRKYFSKRYVSKKDYLIILGDAGIAWNKKDFAISRTRYDTLGPTVFYIDGNHENFDMLNSFPIVKINSAYVHKLSSNIYHILRGEVLILNGISFLCVGGAESIDKELRIEGISWWKDESIRKEDIDKALNNLSLHNMKVDYILTHTAPSCIHNKKFYFRISQSVEQLDRLKGNAIFDKWYFGHYHVDEKFRNGFRCLYDDIIEISAMNNDETKIRYRELITSKGKTCLINATTGKCTKIEKQDLPEWYFRNSDSYPRYYCLKDVVDVDFSNSLLEDGKPIINLSYDNRIKRNKRTLNQKEKRLHVIRNSDIVSFTLALEKYSPHLNLNKLKERINLYFDECNRKEESDSNHALSRPFPEVKTKVLKNIKYEVKEGDDILCEFYDLYSAKAYVEKYINKNLMTSYIRILAIRDDYLQYDTNHDCRKWIKIIPLQRLNK